MQVVVLLTRVAARLGLAEMLDCLRRMGATVTDVSLRPYAGDETRGTVPD